MRTKDHTVFYGLNLILRRYILFPPFCTLPVIIQHGWYRVVSQWDIGSYMPLMLVYSKRMYNEWKKVSRKHVTILGAPYLVSKARKTISLKNDAFGTIALPLHSSDRVKSEYNIEKYCQDLNNLPIEFKPIFVCLHHDDLTNGVADEYKKRNFDVVTAGDKFNKDFFYNLYTLLSNYKYMTSNGISTSTFIAVDFGMPFFICGEPPVFYNFGNDKVPDVYSSVDDALNFDACKVGYDLFNTGPTDQISLQQKAFVDAENGKYDRDAFLIIFIKIWFYYFVYLLVRTKFRFREIKKILNTFFLEKLPRLIFIFNHRFLFRLADKYRLFVTGLDSVNKIGSSLSLKEKFVLYDYARRKGNHNALEIGLDRGASTNFILKGLNKNALLYSLLDDNDVLSIEFNANTRKYGEKLKVNTMKEFPSYTRMSEKRIDFVFINLNYTTLQVQFIWNSISAFFNKGCIVAIHFDCFDENIISFIDDKIAPVADICENLSTLKVYKMSKIREI